MVKMPGRPPSVQPPHAGDCFVVLPDNPVGQAAAGRLPAEGAAGSGALVLRYPSGRPWLVARTPLRRISTARRGQDAVAVIGAGAPVDGLDADLAAARDNGALHDRLARRLPGVHHVISRVGGESWVRGTATGLRRVYAAEAGGAGEGAAGAAAGGWVASDRPAVLAHLTGAALDDTALALRLLDFVPHPLSGRPLWRGVTETHPEHALVLCADGGRAQRRWWHAPEPELPLHEGASALGAALDAAVRAHVTGRPRVSCELSGGLDSTSLTFLARHAAPDARLDLITVASRESHAEDETWARRAVELTDGTGVAHHLVPAHEAPLFYAGVADPPGPGDIPTDEPLPVAPARARALLPLTRAAALGSGCHLTGYGGDELFMALPTVAADLFPRHPLAAWNRVGAVRHQLGWPLIGTLRALFTRPSFRTWLAGAVSDTAAPPTTRTPQLGWGVVQSLPPWLTDDARTLIRDAFREAARAGARPFAARPGRHLDLDTVRIGARHFQAMEDHGLGLGLPVAAPLYADHVLEATLSVRLADRIDPGRYKPLLAEAVRGVVPAPLLARTTKDHMSGDIVQGLVRHGDELGRLWEPGGSRLAALGLVDADRLTDLAADPYSPLHTRWSIDAAVSCEMWLRATEPAEGKVLTP
ncbi:asparagine synthase-related protein [Streptomyces sp. VRA16 Mangrove soil]|uniref:asparagine synthase-related protein n=1 Tax=Streptomyces sp. VRA16 Mangrove soil TaxID=2817434 RepID=UPI001A9E070E|nr:asparagine synthase-related protein [Streptomyces sp. VRA16 Mangrove soil]MBO1336287.1 asparagine synthase [Streptomyces sp. VRA16 Mangrove soil]